MKYFLTFFLLISMSIAPVSAQVLSSGPTYSDFRLKSQNVRIYNAKISTDSGKYGFVDTFRDRLVERCISQETTYETDYDIATITNTCQQETVDALNTTVSLIQEGKESLQRSMKMNNLQGLDVLLLPDSLLIGTPWFDVMETRVYKNGVRFLVKHQENPGWDVSINNYYVGFIRYDAKYREIKANLMPIAPEKSPQFVTYTKLYTDMDTFEADIRKAFLANKFSNKNTQSAYATFLANLWTN